jgi:hypothetical protein
MIQYGESYYAEKMGIFRGRSSEPYGVFVSFLSYNLPYTPIDSGIVSHCLSTPRFAFLHTILSFLTCAEESKILDGSCSTFNVSGSCAPAYFDSHHLNKLFLKHVKRLTSSERSRHFVPCRLHGTILRAKSGESLLPHRHSQQTTTSISTLA